MTDFHRMTVEDSLKHLATSYFGLEEKDVAVRLAQYGNNTLLSDSGTHRMDFIQRIIFDLPSLLLLPSALILVVLSRDFPTLIFLSLVILLNTYIILTALGKNIRTIRSTLNLGHIQKLKVIVRRANQLQEIDAENLVPGDIVLLEQGDRIPADGRVITSANLQVLEVYLTGNQEPVEKDPTSIDTEETLKLSELRNMVFMGTMVYKGRGEIVITQTGLQTEIGKVGVLLKSGLASPSKAGNPRSRKLNLQIALFAIIVSGGGLLLSVNQQSPFEAILLAVATIILASVPEALPAALNRVAAVESQRIRKFGANLKHPENAETLGTITTLCISEQAVRNKLDYAVKMIDLPDQTWEFDPSKSERGGFVLKSGELPLDTASNPLLNGLVFAMTLMSYPSEIAMTEQGEPLIYGGNTLEQALLAAASKLGVSREIRGRITEEFPLVTTYPLEEISEAAVYVYELDTKKADLFSPFSREFQYAIYAKGSARQITNLCSSLVLADEQVPLTKKWREEINLAIDRIENKFMDAYAFSMCVVKQLPYGDISQQLHTLNMALIGLIGISAASEEEYLKYSSDYLREAGIRTLLLSIKSPEAVLGMGSILGVQDGRIIVNTELDQMTEEEIAQVIQEVSLFARVDLAHKQRVVQALQEHGHIVAVTGEGAADLPIMLQADVGILLAGSEENLAEHFADISIFRPSGAFPYIPHYIEEGRTIQDNIHKIVRYLLSCNLGEIVVILGCLLVGLPNPLVPLQILLLNMVTNGLPALSLASERPEVEALQRAPYETSVQILNRSMILLISYYGLLMGLLSMLLGYIYYSRDPLGVWGTMIFASLGFSQIFTSLALRAKDDPVFRIGIFSSKTMNWAIFLAFSLLMFTIYFPALQPVFNTKPLSLINLAFSLLPGITLFVLIELGKFFKYRKNGT